MKKKAERIIPQRKFKGLVGFDDLSPSGLLSFKELTGKNPGWISAAWLNEALFLSDGQKNLFQIKQCLSKEGLRINVKELISYFTFLREVGKIEWLRKGRLIRINDSI